MSDYSMIIVLVIVLGIVGYLFYMRNKVRHYVLRNDKIEKYFK